MYKPFFNIATTSTTSVLTTACNHLPWPTPRACSSPPHWCYWFLWHLMVQLVIRLANTTSSDTNIIALASDQTSDHSSIGTANFDLAGGASHMLRSTAEVMDLKPEVTFWTCLLVCQSLIRSSQANLVFSFGSNIQEIIHSA